VNPITHPEYYRWVMVCPTCKVEGTFNAIHSRPGTVECNHCGATISHDTLKEQGRYRVLEEAAKNGLQTLEREFKSVKNMQARLGNAIALAKASPENANKDELMACLLDVRKLTEKLRADLEADMKTYGL
jgi:phage terminase large subunit GpA-like protein